MDPIQQQELVREMVLELVEVAPEGWVSMNFRYEYIGGVAASENIVTFDTGEAVRKRHPRPVDKKARALKIEMYQEGKGTWLAMSINIKKPGDFKVDFYYDKELGVHPLPASPGSYAFELEKFPRDPEVISDWIRERISQLREE
ncbi:immunity protein YezG family protein [Nocardiopsis lambiniae]|uniref:DUF600 family protein n=1 Tax=Nocardiopsis lambiniae TaxID=3075539 RepID=A0ABU2M2L2_9ACTN|nr:immunity protein YezG family protein [Nocardiopsis sp. DSM 44743]MDT0326883.1 DUF600 family protein [Nocardiopsis sp. DSM 44743]